MKKLLTTLALTPLLIATVHADDLSNDINMNMLWSDNEEFQRINQTEDQTINQTNANMLWADNDEFHRVNLSQENRSDYINQNMLWSNNKEFHEN